MFDYFNKDQFDLEDRAPANAKTTSIAFMLFSILADKPKIETLLETSFSYLVNGELIAIPNYSFHEYDWALLYILDVKYITDLDFDIDNDDIENAQDEAYIRNRFNARDKADHTRIFYLPETEYKYFIEKNAGPLWDFIEGIVNISHYLQSKDSVVIESWDQLSKFMDVELIKAVKAWKNSKENY